MNAARKAGAAVATDAAEGFMSVHQAAKAIGRADSTVLSLLLKGELVGKEFADRQWVSRASVAEYNAARAGATTGKRTKTGAK